MDVIFRVDKTRGAYESGHVFAVFPFEWANDFYLTGYAHIGQHFGAAWDFIRDCSRPATPEEAAPLLEELNKIGYADLKQLKRLPSLQKCWKNRNRE